MEPAWERSLSYWFSHQEMSCQADRRAIEVLQIIRIICVALVLQSDLCSHTSSSWTEQGEGWGDGFCGASGVMVGLDDLEGLFEP